MIRRAQGQPANILVRAHGARHYMKKKILVVDDDPDLRGTLKLLLTPEFEVVEAANGREALAILDREHPALALVDLAMPEMDGLQFLDASRAKLRATIVVMLTAEANVDLALAAFKDGAKTYVTKPFDLEMLRSDVRYWLDPPAKDDSGRPWRVAEAKP